MCTVVYVPFIGLALRYIVLCTETFQIIYKYLPCALSIVMFSSFVVRPKYKQSALLIDR